MNLLGNKSAIDQTNKSVLAGIQKLTVNLTERSNIHKLCNITDLVFFQVQSETLAISD